MPSQRLRTSLAVHSPMMDPILESFVALVRGSELKSPCIPYVSGVTGTWITDTEATDPSYWARQLRQTVRFADGMTQLLEDKQAICLEVGPGRTLTGLALLHESRSGQEVIASMRSQRDATSEVEALLSALGRLWTAGAKVDWRGFHSGETRRRLQLPTYPFELKRYWINPVERSAPMRLST